jgi:deoxyribose-phosphate aldolase
MDIEKILSRIDHTLLLPSAKWEEIKEICDDALKFKTACVCIPPCFVRKAAGYLAGALPVCTVVGFPNGYSTTKAKAFEAADAVSNGAGEIDMVINIGLVKEKRFGSVLEEINEVKRACGGRLLKVIIETCVLSEAEKIEMCRVMSESGAEYIKTSTGFSTGGATFEDVALIARHIDSAVKIKAAGGIKTLDDAERFIALGASRLGTSRIVKILKDMSGDAPGGGY